MATRSAGKLRELVPLLTEFGFHAISLDDAGIPERDEEHDLEGFDTFEENASAKARYFASRSNGRLVLADVLWYAQQRFKPKAVIDLATLTGACVVALGEDVAGAFSNDQSWCDAVLSAAKGCGEDAWQLPMWDLYDDLIKGDVGDIKNTGGRWGGAITAAKFLQRFAGKYPWAHLDIAGTAWKSGKEKGATGRPVPLLTQFLIKRAARS